MTDYRKVTLGDAYNISNVLPLQGEDFKKYYYDLSQVRNTEAVNRVKFKLISAEANQTQTILFTGHRGGGKTTELRKLEKELNKEYFIIYFMADQELDINDTRYTDLYLVIIKQVEEQLRKEDINLDKKLLKSFENWFRNITKEHEETVETSISLEAGSQIGSDLPFLAKLWVKLLAQIKGSDKIKKIIRENLEQDISRLKADINALLRDGTKKLREKYSQYKGILIIVDNLDRVPINVGDHLFFDYATQLQELDCNIIYAIKQEQFAFERVIPDEHYKILAEVCLSKNLDNKEIAQEVLYNTSVLEYNGNNRWNYVNPVIKNSDLFQEALKSL